MSGKLETSLFVAAIGCIVFLFVFPPAARSAEKTVWAKFDNSVPAASDLAAMNGRISIGTAGKGDAKHANSGCVIKDGAFYKMWYSGTDGTNYRIYYATSPDGLNWAKYNNVAATNSDTISTDGRIGLGTAGRGDSNGVYDASVIKDGSTYKMWYTGDDGGTNRIYYAFSPDGLTWTKKNNAIPADSDTTSDDGRIPLGIQGGGKGDVRNSGYPTVILDGSTYKMWYAGDDGTHYRIYYATSANGLTWTKYSNSVPPNSNTEGTNGCIPLGTSGGDTNGVSYPAVIKDGSTYRLWYAGKDFSAGWHAWRIYLATSTDGLKWTKKDNTVPPTSNTTGTNGRIPLGSGSGDTGIVAYPTVIMDGTTYKMWYAGFTTGNYRTYLATSTDSLTWTKKDNSKPDDSDPGNGRIPLGTDGQGDDKYVIYQSVIKDGSTNRMWYSGHDGDNWRIYYATSLDGLTWVKYDNNAPDNSDSICTNGTIALGLAAGTGDKNGALNPSVIKDGSFYKMWYTGQDGGNTGRIYHATSSNGLTWTKYTNAIPDPSNTTGTKGRIPLGTSGTGDEKSTRDLTVIKDGSFYKMWYSGYDNANKWRIYYATSSNGLTWTKYTNAIPNPSNTTGTKGRIPLGTSGGDEKHARNPTVIKKGSTYKMWYEGTDVDASKKSIYYATSTDGLTWTKYTNAIPAASDTTSTKGRVPLGITGGDTNVVMSPCVVKDGYAYKMWYGGYDGINYRIYHATLDALPEGMIFIGH